MDRADELNDRIHGVILEQFLEPVFDPRPVNTRGGTMPEISTSQSRIF